MTGISLTWKMTPEQLNRYNNIVNSGWENSCLCLEDGLKPATANLINLQSIYNDCLEGGYILDNDTVKLVQHHEKYLEIHGEDKIVLMTKSEHMKLHKRLRRENKCNIPVDKLRKISSKANQRTKKYREDKIEYRKAHKNDAIEYRQMHKKEFKEYKKRCVQRIDFYESFGQSTRLHEIIEYNQCNGNVGYSAIFKGTNQHVLPIINCQVYLK